MLANVIRDIFELSYMRTIEINQLILLKPQNFSTFRKKITCNSFLCGEGVGLQYREQEQI